MASSISGQFLGDDYSLEIYKIYCSPTKTIYLLPNLYKTSNFKHDKYVSGFTGSIDDASRQYDLLVEGAREDILMQANNILDICPVDSNFFDDFEYTDYLESNTYSSHWEIDCKYLWNYSVDIKPLTVKRGSRIILNGVFINVSNNNFACNGANYMVKVIPDNDKYGEDYYEGVAAFYGGDETQRKGEVNFEDNITLDVRMFRYIDGRPDLEIGHTIRTFTKNELEMTHN